MSAHLALPHRVCPAASSCSTAGKRHQPLAENGSVSARKGSDSLPPLQLCSTGHCRRETCTSSGSARKCSALCPLPPRQVIRASTVAPAAALGVGDIAGSLAVGREVRPRAVELSWLTLIIGRFSRDYREFRFKNTIIPLPSCDLAACFFPGRCPGHVLAPATILLLPPPPPTHTQTHTSSTHTLLSPHPLPSPPPALFFSRPGSPLPTHHVLQALMTLPEPRRWPGGHRRARASASGRDDRGLASPAPALVRVHTGHRLSLPFPPCVFPPPFSTGQRALGIDFTCLSLCVFHRLSALAREHWASTLLAFPCVSSTASPRSIQPVRPRSQNCSTGRLVCRAVWRAGRACRVTQPECAWPNEDNIAIQVAPSAALQQIQRVSFRNESWWW